MQTLKNCTVNCLNNKLRESLWNALMNENTVDSVFAFNKEISDLVRDRQHMLELVAKSKFNVGDMVKVNHDKLRGKVGIILKKHSKNVKVEFIDDHKIYTISPSLLERA